MARFFPLEVADIRRETRDAVVVTLAPRAEDRAAFDFTQGQYLTFRRDFEGEELRRSYSICAGKDEGVLKVGIKRVDGGAFSTWANEDLKPGDVVEAMPPMGAFHVPLKPEEKRHYLGFAGGSGITPVLSLIKTTLAREPGSRFTLVYGNRSVSSIMFREELEDIKNTHLGRFNVVHVLESEAQEVELFSGRIDAEKCARLFKGWINIAAIDMAFICGPEPMMLAIAAALREHGLRDDQIKFELFASAPRRGKHVVRMAADTGKAATCTATITLDGTTRVIEMAKTGQTILEAALGASLDAPYACKAGVCSTCRAMVVEGEVEMATNHALEDYEVRQGYVLSCQCYPLSDRVVVTYDQ
ncbi:1,2-phenylacetyl-CoA epoxidase subunit PaaE [Bosea sp. (in: a-proteobacteria)]|jgi:ring-1,2-phenylacetyl-CoA epoxidase subunit PaaE|uniref:1,2-phenylacetyl-CoA epoxidase subunit PaaE n=1 Tax=Bosea sp. (in: a-proteobacteria) TaxID=1871050 RepID=UPI002DDD5211|nr:1,2-phenylacetyl-CoA epoxidase subunit PaaE [Bosea sp. (in: a-proteobacteria)]HEV2508751.1 1,2-phenylacetyl-CoA epoxidase subunit PaaE [Bosea sp. (in: a-proteobacteria)]